MKKRTIRLNEAQLHRIIKNSVVKVLREEAMKDALTAKAKELYHDVEWEDHEIEDQDGPYATGTVWGTAEDENGGVWEFVGAAGFNWEGGWSLDTVTEVQFTSPDGQTGYFHL